MPLNKETKPNLTSFLEMRSSSFLTNRWPIRFFLQHLVKSNVAPTLDSSILLHIYHAASHGFHCYMLPQRLIQWQAGTGVIFEVMKKFIFLVWTSKNLTVLSLRLDKIILKKFIRSFLMQRNICKDIYIYIYNREKEYIFLILLLFVLILSLSTCK